MKELFSAFSWQQYVMIVVTHLITGSIVWVGMDLLYSYQV